MNEFDEIKISGRQIVDDREFFCKYVWVIVKATNYLKVSEYKTKEKFTAILELHSSIRKTLSHLTPEEFERTFPIIKEYDGEKNGFKDYFYAKEALKKFAVGKPLFKSGDINKLLWDYLNTDINLFIAAEMECINALRRLEGLHPMLEEFAQIEAINIYRRYTYKDTGKEFLIYKKGKTIPLSKPRPHNLNVIQGGKR